MSTPPVLSVRSLQKSFTLHHQGGLRLPVLDAVSLDVAPGECVVVDGVSGTGKSTLLRCVYGNYATDRGAIVVRAEGCQTDVASAGAREVLRLRRHVIGYVSQFLRVIPRVPALDLVAEPLIARGETESVARDRAAAMLSRLHVAERLWPLPPATFSGGEQQRVNVARVLTAGYPLLLLDEPTASLDAANRATVVHIVQDALAAGAAVLGVFHDSWVREVLADRLLRVGGGSTGAAA